MLGITAEAVGIAVRRAITRASDWRDHDWRLIHEPAQEPVLHMALDQVLAEEVGAGRRPPTLRVWEWASPAVVIGSFQSLRNEVDAAAAATRGRALPPRRRARRTRPASAGIEIAHQNRPPHDTVP
jgi:lipoate-protein ligase A